MNELFLHIHKDGVSPDYFDVNVTGLTFTAEIGSTNTFIVNSNLEWNISNDISWLSLSSYSGLSTTEITATIIDKNTTRISRSGITSILVDTGTIHRRLNILMTQEDKSLQMELTISGLGQSVTIPHLSGYTYDYRIDYGDGSPEVQVSSYDDTGCTHFYLTPSVYNVVINGICESLYINNGGNFKLLLTKVFTWGDVGLKALSLNGCSNLTTIVGDTYGCFASITSFNNTFKNCTSLLTIPTNLFNYSGVTNFISTFYNCTSLSGVAPELWNLYPTAYGNVCFTNDNGLTNYTDALNAGWADYLIVDSGVSFSYHTGAVNTFTITSNQSWTITENIVWLSLDSYSGSGTTVITGTILSDNISDIRSDTLSVDAPYISNSMLMSQGYLNIDKTGLTFSYSSGLTDTFSINTNLPWSITESIDWFSVSSYSGIGSSVITGSTLSGNTVAVRSGITSIIVDGVSTNLVISQGYFNVSTTELTFGYSSGSTNVLTINTNLSWVISEDIDWLQFNNYSGEGTTILTGTAVSGNTGSARTGITSLVVDGKTTSILITQSAPPSPPQISTGQHSLAIDNLGQTWSWGFNASGELGDNTLTQRNTPITVCGNHTFTKISAGLEWHSLAIDNLGVTWAWGRNTYGILGNNSVVIRLTPVTVCGNHTFTQISAGGTHSLALDNLGQVWGWGYNNKGQLGDNTAANCQSTPIAVCGGNTFTTISAGYQHSIGIDNLGKAWGWGRNDYGQLGDNTLVSKSTPVAVCGNHTFIQIDAGQFHSVAIDNLGMVWGWGSNHYGQLGNNSGGYGVKKSTPVAVCGNKTFIQISAGYKHTLAIDNSGVTWGWGYNMFSQLGNNAILDKSTPVAVCGNHTFTTISAGYNYSLGVDNLGQVWGWGYNYRGNLGDNTIVSKKTPVRVCNL